MFTVISWDWKAQPKIKEINLALEAVFDLDANYPPAVTEAPVESDEYRVVVSTCALSRREIAAAVAIAEELQDEGNWEEGQVLPDSLIEEYLSD